MCAFIFISASSTDDDSLANDDIQSTPERERARITPDTSSTGSARETPPQQRLHRPPRSSANGGPGHTVWEERDERKRSKQEITQLADVMHNLNPCKLNPFF